MWSGAVRRSGLLIGVLAATALILTIGASDVAADHCGARMEIMPTSGPGGTTFLIQPNLGAETVLRLYRDDRLVLTKNLGNPAQRYAFTSRSGDAGAWRADAWTVSDPACGSDGRFRITGLPSTSIQDTPSAAAESTGSGAPPASTVILVAAALAGATAGWRRVRRVVG